MAVAPTPGPWLALYLDDSVTGGKPTWTVQCNEPDVLTVAHVYRGYGEPGEDEANARLIAAAPGLLAACESMLAHLVTTFPPYPPGESPHDKIRAAVSKATKGA
jgi:hypothetical protein